MIKIISHQILADQYTHEIAVVSIDDKFRLTYCRKQKKDGSKFWAPVNLGYSDNGQKKYISAFEFDSKFMAQDIIKLLESKPWERQQQPNFQSAPPSQPSYKQSDFFDPGEPPF